MGPLSSARWCCCGRTTADPTSTCTDPGRRSRSRPEAQAGAAVQRDLGRRLFGWLAVLRTATGQQASARRARWLASASQRLGTAAHQGQAAAALSGQHGRRPGSGRYPQTAPIRAAGVRGRHGWQRWGPPSATMLGPTPSRGRSTSTGERAALAGGGVRDGVGDSSDRARDPRGPGSRPEPGYEPAGPRHAGRTPSAPRARRSGPSRGTPNPRAVPERHRSRRPILISDTPYACDA